MDRLTQKQEGFIIDVFKGMSQRDAYIKNYHPTYSIATIDANASRLASNEKVSARLAELRQKVESVAVMSQQEIEERLTEIGRARLVDFVDENGKITLRVANDGALQEFVITDWKGGKEERAASRTTKIKLHNPMTAMDMLIRMRGKYPPANVLQLEPGEKLSEALTELLSGLRGYGNKDKE